MKENTKNWLNKAEEDIITCELLLNAGFFPASVVCFHSQQIAEKYLKAFLTENNIDFRRTHDLVDLMINYILQLDNDFEILIESCEYLTDYGVLPRYPGDYPEISVDEAQKAFKKATEIKNFVLKKLSR